MFVLIILEKPVGNRRDAQRNKYKNFVPLIPKLALDQRGTYEHKYIFNLNNEIRITEESDDLNKIIEDKSISIIGGHSSLIKKIKEKYPSIKHASKESHVTQSLIKNADYVFLITDFQSHGMYYKAMKYLNAYDVKWDYINGVNLELIEKEMIKKLKG